MIPQTEFSATQVERQARPRRLVIFRITTILVGLLVGLLIAELGLRVVEKVRMGDWVAPATVPDPFLRSRIIPNRSGHDANGFRNASVRSQVDIVVLGDSQTWGVNVQGVDAWPPQLERISGRPVYNMAVGAYGPIQYWMLTEKAVSFAPKEIVVGLYFGNDLYDAYELAYSNDKYAELRSNQAYDQVKIDTIKTRSQFFWDEEKNFHDNYRRSSPRGWSFWLRVHSATGRLLNRAGLWPGATDVDYEINREWTRAYPDHGAACEDPDVRTVFTTAYRFAGLDLDDPRVGEGLRITKEVLWRIRQQADKSGVKLMVLLIPTKELVYAELMQQEGRSTGTYARLVEMENRSRKEVVASWCAEKRIACVDALPDLRSAINRRQRIYPSDTESHPNAAGYGILATTVAEALKKEGR